MTMIQRNIISGVFVGSLVVGRSGDKTSIRPEGRGCGVVNHHQWSRPMRSMAERSGGEGWVGRSVEFKY